MKLAWVSDIHLDFLDDPRVDSFVRELEASRADAFLCGHPHPQRMIEIE